MAPANPRLTQDAQDLLEVMDFVESNIEVPVPLAFIVAGMVDRGRGPGPVLAVLHRLKTWGYVNQLGFCSYTPRKYALPSGRTVKAVFREGTEGELTGDGKNRKSVELFDTFLDGELIYREPMAKAEQMRPGMGNNYELTRDGMVAARREGPEDPPEADRSTAREMKTAKWLAKAMLLVQQHPDWSDATIAERVGKHKSTLSRNRMYKTAAELARAQGGPPKGYRDADKDGEGAHVEAVDDGPEDE